MSTRVDPTALAAQVTEGAPAEQPEYLLRYDLHLNLWHLDRLNGAQLVPWRVAAGAEVGAMEGAIGWASMQIWARELPAFRPVRVWRDTPAGLVPSFTGAVGEVRQ